MSNPPEPEPDTLITDELLVRLLRAVRDEYQRRYGAPDKGPTPVRLNDTYLRLMAAGTMDLGDFQLLIDLGVLLRATADLLPYFPPDPKNSEGN